MSPESSPVTFRASRDQNVSALLLRPPDARWLLVLGHGAGADMRSAHLEAIAQHLARAGLATLRYNFPYMERRERRVDSRDVALATVRAAVVAARAAVLDLPLLLGGHSYGGRMGSNAVAEGPLEDVLGLVLFSFPLHPAGRPGTERAEHLRRVGLPMLFLSGTRDPLAAPDLLVPVCRDLPAATLHLVETADHGFKVLKRGRESRESPYQEAARVAAAWAAALAS